MTTQAETTTKLSLSGNFDVWRWRLEFQLHDKGLVQFVQRPPRRDPSELELDRKTRSLISSLVDDEVAAKLTTCIDAYSMYGIIKSLFAANEFKREHLLSQLSGLELTAGKANDFFSSLDSLNTQLGLTGAKLSDQEIFRFVRGAIAKNPALNSLNGTLIGLPNERRSWETVKSIVLTFDEDVAATMHYHQVQSARGPPKKYKFKGNCNFCGIAGHMEKHCRKKKTQQARGQAGIPIQGRASSITGQLHSLVRTDTEWLIDSGASDHFVRDRNLFQSLKPCPPFKVTVANGQQIVCHFKGPISFYQFDGMLLTLEAFYAPELEYNYYAVQRADAAGLEIRFQNGSCTIEDDVGVYLQVPKVNKVYSFQMLPSPDSIHQVKTSGATSHLHGISNIEDKPSGTWHQRLGHINVGKLRELSKSHDYIEADSSAERCETCALGKAKRPNFRSQPKATTPLELIHSDLCHVDADSVNGSRYFQTVIDDYSSYCQIFILDHKDQAGSNLIRYIRWAERQLNQKVKCVRTDGGGEYRGQDFKIFLEQEGITHDVTPPYTPESNGTAERRNRVLLDMARCLLIDSKVPDKYWNYAVRYANFLVNRTPSKAVHDAIPYERFFGKDLDLRHAHTFGCLAYLVDPRPISKLAPRAFRCAFLGLTEDHQRSILLRLDNNTVQVHRTVHCVDTEFPFNKQGMKTPAEPSSASGPPIILLPREKDSSGNTASGEPSVESSSMSSTPSFGAPVQDLLLRRSTRVTKGIPPERYQCGAIQGCPAVTETYKQAVESPERNYRLDAMSNEINCLIDFDVFEIVQRPTNSRVLPIKWHFALKKDSNGCVERFKARIVAKGFCQIEGVDFNKVHAPASNLNTDHHKDRFELHQAPYILEPFDKFGMKDCWPWRNPFGEFYHAIDEFVLTDVPYRELSTNSIFWSRAKQVLAYLKATINVKLILSAHYPEPLVVYTDSGFAGDKRDFKSTSGVLVKVFGEPVYWPNQTDQDNYRGPKLRAAHELTVRKWRIGGVLI